MAATRNALLQLRKHADYQRVYGSSRKQHTKDISYFYSLRPPDRRSDTPGPRVGLTVGKVMGKAVDRNRIKRRLRECIRHQQDLLPLSVDIILHPRRAVLQADFRDLEREVATVFKAVRKSLTASGLSSPPSR